MGENNHNSQQFEQGFILRLLSHHKELSFQEVLRQSGLVETLIEQIISIYSDFQISQWEASRQQAYGNGRTDEQFEGELLQIENLMRRHLAKTLFLSTELLLMKSRKLVITGKPLTFKESHQLAEEFAKVSDDDLFIANGSGGARREREALKTNDELKSYANKVNSLYSLWKHITIFFRNNDYESSSIEKIKKTNKFKLLTKDCSNIPIDLLKDVFKRKSDSSEEFSPTGFAIKHAARELGISYEFNTLRSRYYEGKRLLKSC